MLSLTPPESAKVKLRSDIKVILRRDKLSAIGPRQTSFGVARLAQIDGTIFFTRELLMQLEEGDEYASHSLVARSAARASRAVDAHARHLTARQ